jgi:flagellar biosynthesis/type III secretory pathway protein FliH
MISSSNFAASAASLAPIHGREAIAWSPDDLASQQLHAPITGPRAADETTFSADLVAETRRIAFDEGFQAGEDSERTRLFQVARALEDGVASVQDGVDRWISNAEENISALAVAIARHILAREVTVDRESTMDVVRKAIAEFSIDHPVTVRLHPADYAVIMPMLVNSGADTSRRDAEWIADGRIAPGGCVVEGRERIVDGRIDTALERVYRRLTYTGA